MQATKVLYPLDLSLKYLEDIFQLRLEAFFNNRPLTYPIQLLPKPEWNGMRSSFTDFISNSELEDEAFIILLIALAPHIQPDFFDRIIQKYLPESGNFPKLGGVRSKNNRCFMPTGETAVFILGGDHLEDRFKIQQFFSQDHFFAKNQILWLEEVPESEPINSGKIIISREYTQLFCFDKVSPPDFSLHFPATKINTNLEWNNLVLNTSTQGQLNEIKAWLNHGNTLLQDWGMKDLIKPGYRALFFGPPGTGKTLTASLLGKYYSREVYRVDLSMVVSKYIGETEKNLSNLFAKSENKNWILFFDEADALFGKRTNIKDAHDKFANQEVAYLLQRVENYNGLVILATNLKKNIDEAFLRRFQSIVHFPMPSASERLAIWGNAFPSQLDISSIDLKNIAQNYKLTGAGIFNVVQYCCLQVLSQGQSSLSNQGLIEGIKREFNKEGRLI